MDIIQSNIILNLMEQSEHVIVRQNIREEIKYEGNITIIVQGPQLNLNQTIKYYNYLVKGQDANGQFSIRRRYKDFDLLRRRLCQRWLGIYISPISGKRSENDPLYIFKMFQKDDKVKQIKYAQTRMTFLNYFCAGIAARPYLFYCDLFQMFIRGGPDYQSSIYGLIVKQYSFILNAYESNFKLLLNSTHQIQLNSMMTLNQKYFIQLTQSEAKLQHIANQICKSIQAKQQYQKQLNLCLGVVLPQYQQKIYINTIDRQKQRLILNRTLDFNTKLQEYQLLTQENVLQFFFYLILYEIRETKAFIEAIEGRRSAQRRRRQLNHQIQQNMKDKITLQNNQFSLKYLFKTGSKDLQLRQLQMKIEVLKNQKYCFEKMIVIMIQNSNFQIQKYKIKRGVYYVQLMNNVAKKQIQQLNLYNELLNIPLSALQS